MLFFNVLMHQGLLILTWKGTIITQKSLQPSNIILRACLHRPGHSSFSQPDTFNFPPLNIHFSKSVSEIICCYAVVNQLSYCYQL